MNSNIEKLKKLFIEVQNMGWVKSKYRGYGAVGTTFENLIGLSYNEFEIPDYEGIELKTKRRNSNSYISLFSASLDGRYLFGTKEVVAKYGWPSKKYPNVNVLFGDVFGNAYSSIGAKRKMKLDVNYNDKCVYLNVYSRNNKILSHKQYCWSFDLLQEKIIRKLSTLAVILVDSKYIDGDEFFYYREIKFYKLISFERFCKMIDEGFIRVSFRVGVYNNDKYAGKTRDHGTCFAIRECDLEKLFTII